MKFCIVKFRDGEDQFRTTFEGLKEGQPVVVEKVTNGSPGLSKGEFVRYINKTDKHIDDIKPVVGRWLELDEVTSIDVF